MFYRNKKIIILAILIIFTASANALSRETKFYSTSSGLMYMRVTDVIYNETLQMDNGKRKPPTKGNIFAQIMVNFANLTDKPVKDYGVNPIDLSVDPANLWLIGKSGKKYSGMNATKLLRKDVKPFLSKLELKPGEDMVRAMAFHVPKNDKIVGVIYKFDGGYELKIDYTGNSQLQKK